MATYNDIVHSSIRDILTVFFRHRRKTLALFVLTAVLVAAFAYITPEIYRSEAEILIRSGRENLTVDLPESERTMTMLHDRASQESVVNSEMAILKSRDLIEKVVKEFGDDAFLKNAYPPGRERPPHVLDAARAVVRAGKSVVNAVLRGLDLQAELTPHEKAILIMTRGVTIEPMKESNVIIASMDSENRHLAQDALKRLVELYLERHIQVNAAQASPDFFQEQADTKGRELDGIEADLEKFRKEHKIGTIAQQQEVLLLQVKDLTNELGSAAAVAEGSKARIDELEKALKSTTPTTQLSTTTGRHNYARDALKDSLLQLRVQETELASRYVPTYPPLVEVREKIHHAEEMLAEEDPTHTEVTTGINVNHQSLVLELDKERASFKDYSARRVLLEEKLGKAQAELTALADCQVQLERLERQRQIAQEEYHQYRDNVQRANISSALDKVKVSNAGVVQPATLPLKPVRPNKPVIIALGLVLGLLVGIGFGYVCEYFDDTFQNDYDVQRRLRLPVLASVSEEEFRACT
jgi:uncharacterized protein involved in exopolysaccharide biosynthesis